MRIVIFHYHLLPGGVTGVIRNAVSDLLSAPGCRDTIVLAAGNPENLEETAEAIRKKLPAEAQAQLTTAMIPEIGYLSEISGPAPQPDALADLLEKRFGGGDTLWWVHNYQLGKNPPFTQALLNLAARPDIRHKMLFQIHDFPECARFENLKALLAGTRAPLYPVSPAVRYAVINSRDKRLLTDAGLPDEAVFLLDNPVPPANLPKTDPAWLKKRLINAFADRFPAFTRCDSPRYLFYPIRTIRRKNVLEMMMLSYLTGADGLTAPLIVTLPGVSGQEKRYSDLVEQTWHDMDLCGLWGIGNQIDDAGIAFPEMMAGAGHIVSSAVQEGFGYLFINAMQWGKPLTARYLDILDGMKEFFPDKQARFYTQAAVPAGKSTVARTRDAYRSRLNSLKGELTEKAAELLTNRLEAVFHPEHCPDDGRWIDFSYLAVEDQRAFLLKLKQDPGLCRESAEALAPLLSHLRRGVTSPADGAGFLADAEEKVAARFGREAYREQVQRIVESFERRLPANELTGNRVNENLINAFADPAYLRLLYQ